MYTKLIAATIRFAAKQISKDGVINKLTGRTEILLTSYNFFQCGPAQ
jgi:hypothetical protein